MDYTKFSGAYTVRRLLRDDIPSIFALCEKNPQYYEHCPPFVTPEKIEADMKAMPQRKTGQEQDKYYLGYFDVHQRLVAVMDFIDHYPDAQSGFIGFFMMEKDLQGTGVGSSIITELCACLVQWDSFGLCGWKRTKQIVLAEESIHRHRLERSYKRLHRRCDESFLDKSVDQKAEKTDQEYTNCIHTAKRPLELKIEPSGLNWQKLEKRGLFHSPIFHITCIIRNLCH